jgi:hypothetical protein
MIDLETLLRDPAALCAVSVRGPDGDVRGHEDPAVAVTVTPVLTRVGDEAHLVVTVRNDEPEHVVTEVVSARLRGLRLPDDSLVLPYAGGERLVGVASSLAAILTGPDRVLRGTPRVVDDGGTLRYDLNYCGPGSMMWLDYLGGGMGLYLGSHDPAFRTTILRTATRDGDSVDLELAWPTRVLPGETWQSPTAVVALHDEDWHQGAARYRAWFDTVTHLTPGSLPWRELTALYLPFMKVMDGRVRHRFEDLPTMAQAWSTPTMDAIAPYGWSDGGFDTLDPHYYPDLELGGPGAMRRAYAQIREGGGHLMGYLNARIFNTRSHVFPTLGERWAVRSPTGELTTESYGPPEDQEHFAVMCPEVKQWRDLLVDFAEELTGYGIDLVYYDQVALARTAPCHVHDHGAGGWNEGYRALLRETHERLPDQSICIEGCGDLHAPWAVIQSSAGVLLLGTEHAFPELFKFTFPEVHQADLVYFTSESQDSMYKGFLPLLTREQARHALCQGIIAGSCFGVFDQNFEDTDWWAEARSLLEARAAVATQLAESTYRDTVDVVEATPGLDVRTFACHDGSTVVAAHNPALLDDARVVVVHAGGKVDVPIPAKLLTLTVL